MTVLTTEVLWFPDDPTQLELDIRSGLIEVCCPCQAVRDYGLSQEAAEKTFFDLAECDPDPRRQLVAVDLEHLEKFRASGHIDQYEFAEGQARPALGFNQAVVWVRRSLLADPMSLLRRPEIKELFDVADVIESLVDGSSLRDALGPQPAGKLLSSLSKRAVRLARVLGLVPNQFDEQRISRLSRLLVSSRVLGFRNQAYLRDYVTDPVGFVVGALANTPALHTDQRKDLLERLWALANSLEPALVQGPDGSVPETASPSVWFQPHSALYVVESIGRHSSEQRNQMVDPIREIFERHVRAPTGISTMFKSRVELPDKEDPMQPPSSFLGVFSRPGAWLLRQRAVVQTLVFAAPPVTALGAAAVAAAQGAEAATATASLLEHPLVVVLVGAWVVWISSSVVAHGQELRVLAGVPSKLDKLLKHFGIS